MPNGRSWRARQTVSTTATSSRPSIASFLRSQAIIHQHRDDQTYIFLGFPAESMATGEMMSQ